LRVPEHAIAHALLEELKQPLLGTTLILPGSEQPLNDPEDIRDQLEKQIDLVIDGGSCSLLPTTVVDLSGPAPEILRRGRGDVALFI
jgi:tRNA A37 threonylcarbamoyladenosine synthetase subunit TsaC/SUA5/YrdC